MWHRGGKKGDLMASEHIKCQLKIGIVKSKGRRKGVGQSRKEETCQGASKKGCWDGALFASGFGFASN